jgi:radical SAM protein with 4Fe4S-binding SPASM domain
MENQRKEVYFRELKSPLSVQIEVTEKCNFNCLFCYNYWRQSSLEVVSISENDADRIISELIQNNVFSVTITGGEPLLNYKTTLKLIRELNNKNINCSLNTNLSNLTENIGRELLEVGLKTILFSFHSAKRNTFNNITSSSNGFDRVLEGIQIARKLGFNLTANMVLTKFNANEVYETGKFLYDLGIQNFCVTKASPAWGIIRDRYTKLRVERQELVQSLRDMIKLHNDLGMNVDILECYPLCFFPNEQDFSLFTSHKCMAGISTCTIGANGNVRPCSHYHLSYGNIFNEPLKNIWERMKIYRKGNFIPEECKKCKYLQYCSGGCRMEAFYYFNDPQKIDPWVDLNNNTNLENLIRKQIDFTSFDRDQMFRINKKIKIREEDFGGILYLSNKGDVIITKKALEIVKTLLTRNYFTINGIIKEFDFNDKGIKFIESLIKRGFIIKFSTKGGDRNEKN